MSVTLSASVGYEHGRSHPAATTARVFPEISNGLYDRCDTEPVDCRVGRAVLALAHRPLTAWQRLAVRRLKGSGPVSALLRFHRLAFEAERDAIFDRADFYWAEFYRLLPVVWVDDSSWHSTLQQMQIAAAVLDSDGLRTALAREVIRDAHRAFYTALADASGSGMRRAEWHLDRLLTFLPYCKMSAEEERSIAGDLTESRIRRCLDSGDFQNAKTLAAALVDRFPKDSRYQALRIQAEFKLAVNGSDKNPAGVSRLRLSIDQMMAWREPFDDHADLYEALSALYLMHAVSLANAGSVADALVELAKAEAANPTLPGLLETKAQAAELMRQLQAQVRAIEQRLANTPGASLNAEGRRLQREASRGFEPAADWARSEACRGIVAGRTRSQARTLWRDAGLDDACWSMRRGVALMDALSDVLKAGPSTSIEVAGAWHQAASRHNLQELDATAVTRWLVRRVVADTTRAEAPVEPGIAIAAPEKQCGNESVADWLTSRSGRRVRYQLAAAAVLAVVAGGIGARETYRAHARDRAWAALQSAPTPAAALDAAQRFFAVERPIEEPAGRENAAWQAYTESIVRAMAEGLESGSADIQKHLERFAATARRVGRE